MKNNENNFFGSALDVTRNVRIWKIPLQTRQSGKQQGLVLLSWMGNGQISSSDGFRELCRLCEEGDLVELSKRFRWGLFPRAWLDLTEEPSGVRGSCRTPLIIAVQKGHQAIAELLLSSGASVNAGDSAGCAPLTWAALEGRTGLVHLFLSRGADPDGFSVQKRRAQLPPGPAASDKQLFHTPLHCAARLGRRAIVAELLEFGADPFRLTPVWHLTATFLAITKGHAEVARDLLRRAPATALVTNLNNDPPMLWAAHSDNVELLLAVKRAGGDYFTPNSDACSPLQFAVRHGALRTASFLIHMYPHLDSEDHSGRTMLFEAACNGSLSVIRELLLHAADPSRPDRRRRTPLVEARMGGYRECAALIEHAIRVYSSSLFLRCWRVLRRSDLRSALSLPPHILRHIAFIITGDSSCFDHLIIIQELEKQQIVF